MASELPYSTANLQSLLKPLPGIVVMLVEEVEDVILLTDRIKRIHFNRKTAKRRLVFGEVIAVGPRKLGKDTETGRDRWQQPTPAVGSRFYVDWDRHCMRIHPCDADFPEIGALVPEGKTLCFYGRVEPWDTHMLAEECATCTKPL